MASAIVVAAGVPHHMKPWWRPGLPCLTADGDLQVADDGREGRLSNLRQILKNIEDGNYENVIPETDIEDIKAQARRWLTTMEDSQ